jgi:hypothetical protein
MTKDERDAMGAAIHCLVRSNNIFKAMVEVETNIPARMFLDETVTTNGAIVSVLNRRLEEDKNVSP